MTLVATALCADRVAAAAPEIRAQLQRSASDPISRLATRLCVTFRRVVPAVRLHQARREGPMAQSPVRQVVCVPAAVRRMEGSPFQFRLPPPLV